MLVAYAQCADVVYRTLVDFCPLAVTPAVMGFSYNQVPTQAIPRWQTVLTFGSALLSFLSVLLAMWSLDIGKKARSEAKESAEQAKSSFEEQLQRLSDLDKRLKLTTDNLEHVGVSISKQISDVRVNMEESTAIQSEKLDGLRELMEEANQKGATSDTGSLEHVESKSRADNKDEILDYIHSPLNKRRPRSLRNRKSRIFIKNPNTKNEILT